MLIVLEHYGKVLCTQLIPIQEERTVRLFQLPIAYCELTKLVTRVITRQIH